MHAHRRSRAAKRLALIILALLIGVAATAPTRAATNSPPTITGTPTKSITAGQPYRFQPTVSDADGDKLTFGIQNKPRWATFNTSTGLLSGTPTAGNDPNIVISITDGKVGVSLPSFSIAVATSPPTITGTPTKSITAGQPYRFQPTARDADGDKLTFGIQNKPSWATFNTSTGLLSGTAIAGNYSNIVISLTDGKVGVSLPSFSIAVTAAPPTSQSVFLTWIPPTTNTDGSALTNLRGYRIIYGTSPQTLNTSVKLSNAGLTSYVLDGLVPNTYYFAIKSYNAAGTESAISPIISKVLR